MHRCQDLIRKIPGNRNSRRGEGGNMRWCSSWFLGWHPWFIEEWNFYSAGLAALNSAMLLLGVGVGVPARRRLNSPGCTFLRYCLRT